MAFVITMARRLALAWGVHSVHAEHNVGDVPGMLKSASEIVRSAGHAASGDLIVVAAGMPFGSAGTANLLHVAQV